MIRFMVVEGMIPREKQTKQKEGKTAQISAMFVDQEVQEAIGVGA